MTIASDANFSQIKKQFDLKKKAGEEKSTDVTKTTDVKSKLRRARNHFLRLVEPSYDSHQQLPNTSGRFGWAVEIEEKIPAGQLLNSAADWRNALRYVEQNAEGRPLNFDLLKDLHKLSCRNMTFKGYEGRRLLNKYKNKEISEADFKKSLQALYNQGQVFSGQDHQALLGQVRNSELDNLSHQGSARDSNGQRYFTKKEFEAFKANRLVTLVKASYREELDGKIRAEFFYHRPRELEAVSSQIINEAILKIQKTKNLENQIAVALQLQKDLLSVHPFLDGNGRTVRLFMDLLYDRLGLPVPLRPNENDLIMDPKESADYLRSQMIQNYNESLNEVIE
jgi:hypothetical protein